MGNLFPDDFGRSTIPSSYQEMWNSLLSLRNKTKFEYYRAHQAKLLEDYEIIKEDVRDVALCLPTGTGKTAIALSIAYMSQLRSGSRVLYLTPNRQLADQITSEASELGISTVNLCGTWEKIPKVEIGKYQSGSSIGVATYFTLFNSAPQVGNPELIILDDIHAATEAVAQPWTLTVDRRDKNYAGLFDNIFSLFKNQLNNEQISLIQDESSQDERTDLINSREWLLLVDNFAEIVNHEPFPSEKKPPWKYAWEKLEQNLERCFCFISPGRITVRPWISPTFQLNQFSRAKRRVYLSATIDEYGHLERIVSVQSVKRLSGKDVDVPGSRLLLDLNVLLPQAASDVNKVTFFANKVDKVVVLSRGDFDQSELKTALSTVKYSGTILTPLSDKISQDIETFKNANKCILILSNRYDGIDLGNGVADAVLLYKLPLAVNQLEKFTTHQWKAKDEAEARARHRIHQGIGRCTRRESDEIIIGLVGSDLTELLYKPSVLRALPRKLRAEIDLCKKLTNPLKLDALIEAYKTKSDEWKKMLNLIDKKLREYPPEEQEDKKISKISGKYVKYNELLWTRNYTGASDLAAKTAQELVSGNSDFDSAPWFYLASVSEDISQFSATGNPYSAQGTQFIRESVSRAGGRTWFGDLDKYISPRPIIPELQPQLDSIRECLSKFASQTAAFVTFKKEILQDFRDRKDGTVKRGLRNLGKSLGFEAISPDRDGAPDCIWKLGMEAVAIFEAKTEKKLDNPLSVNEIRQILSIPREIPPNEKISVPGTMSCICVTESKYVAAEETVSLDSFLVLNTKVLIQFAEIWLNRLESMHRKHPTDINEFNGMIQSAMIQLRVHGQSLYKAMEIEKASKVLKIFKS